MSGIGGLESFHQQGLEGSLHLSISKDQWVCLHLSSGIPPPLLSRSARGSKLECPALVTALVVTSLSPCLFPLHLKLLATSGDRPKGVKRRLQEGNSDGRVRVNSLLLGEIATLAKSSSRTTE